MGIRLDLKTIASKCHNTEYNPKKFGACVMRLREPKSTMLMFQSGKCVITGARSSHNAALAARKVRGGDERSESREGLHIG